MGAASFCGFQKGALAIHVVDPICDLSMIQTRSRKQKSKPVVPSVLFAHPSNTRRVRHPLSRNRKQEKQENGEGYATRLPETKTGRMGHSPPRVLTCIWRWANELLFCRILPKFISPSFTAQSRFGLRLLLDCKYLNHCTLRSFASDR